MENITQTHVNFEKFAHEANRFINKLSEDFGHPEEERRSLILLRSVMHVIRDRISISESFNLMSQLPLFLRGLYTEQWKYHVKPPLEYDTIEEMKEEVESLQSKYGETEFSWDKPTEELVSVIINCLKEYLSEGQIDHIRNQMPKEIKDLII